MRYLFDSRQRGESQRLNLFVTERAYIVTQQWRAAFRLGRCTDEQTLVWWYLTVTGGVF
jgi:hypothetical protein